ncbi:MAG: hypothetical protein U0R52_11775 [Solirubrobacterales bacterium]
MSERSTASTPAREDLATRGANLVQTLLVQTEERQPQDPDAAPATLVARVFAELAQTAAALGEFAPGESGSILCAGWFASTSAFALSAIARIHPELRDESPATAKNLLIAGLDEDLAQWLEEDERRQDLTPEGWLRATTALLFGAANGVVVLEGLRWEPADGPDEERYWDTPEGQSTEEAISDALLQAAVAAAAAAQWCAERFDELPESEPDDEVGEVGSGCQGGAASDDCKIAGF